MLTGTERLTRTRIRVSPGAGGARCRVRTAVSQSSPTASGLRPVIVHHDATSARVSLVPDGALLLAGDAVEVDVTVDAGARLDLIEPGGTVAFSMAGGRARWDVRLDVARGATLTWAGEPFVVAAGASVDRTTRVRLAGGARVALRESVVLGRYGEAPGAVRQRTRTSEDGRSLLVEDLFLDASTAPGLLGGHRVLASVLLLGAGGEKGAPEPVADRLLLEGGGVLWRRLATQAHEADLAAAWATAQAALP